MKNAFLINELFTYQKLEKNNNDHKVRVFLNPRHKVYEGHFPGNPITPGVCTLQMIKEIAMDLYQVNLQLLHLSSAKFIAFIDPRENPSLEVDIQIKDSTEFNLKVAGTIRNGDQCFVKLLGTYEIN